MPSPATSRARRCRDRVLARPDACRVVVRHGKIADAPRAAANPPSAARRPRDRSQASQARRGVGRQEGRRRGGGRAAAEKNSQEIFKRAEKYVKEYRDQVRFGAIPAASASVFPRRRDPAPAAAAARAHGSRETGPRTARESRTCSRVDYRSPTARARVAVPRAALTGAPRSAAFVRRFSRDKGGEIRASARLPLCLALSPRAPPPTLPGDTIADRAPSPPTISPGTIAGG